jgi:hypothetical protein
MYKGAAFFGIVLFLVAGVPEVATGQMQGLQPEDLH